MRAFGCLIAAMLLAHHAVGPIWTPASEPKPPDKSGGRWALLIGVDDYAELRKLRFSGNDQRAMAEQLIALGFPEDQVFLLHDKATEKKYQPFRENIEKQLALVLDLSAPGDLVIVGFSGHGVQLEGKSYFCPEDTRIDKLAATMIPLDSVYERLAKCKATLKLLMVDACRNDILPEGRRSVVLSRSLGEFDGTKEKPPEGILLLSSCGPGQASMEDEQFGHGVFMHYVLEGLRGKAANSEGGVSLTSLYDYASLQTKKYVARKFNDYQTPALRGEITGPFEICTAAGRSPSQTSASPASVTTPTTLLPAGSTIANSIGMKLVLIPAGEFMMGSGESAENVTAFFNRTYGWDLTKEDYQLEDERPLHRVRISQPFYLGMHHVTRSQFRCFVDDTSYVTDAEKDGQGGMGAVDDQAHWKMSPEYTWRNTGFAQTDEHPVVNVSWNDAVAFCGWLGRKEGKTYRLPTEAEWEYACRARTTTRYHSGDDPETLAQVANVADAAAIARFGVGNLEYAINTNDGYPFSSLIGQFRPNAFGLYDMHGNASQWCADWFGSDYYAASPQNDPTGPDSGKHRVLRGCGWNFGPCLARSASRNWMTQANRSYYTGFRVARTL